MSGIPTWPTPPAPPADEPQDEPQAEAGSLDNWPEKGYDGAQPWDHKALGIDTSGLGEGEPDTISPVKPREGLPQLSHGSAGLEVRTVAVALGHLGYDNSISRGSIDNAYNVVDDSVMAAVEAFRRDYNVAEDPSQYPRDPANAALTHIGPWTQEAILRAAERDEK